MNPPDDVHDAVGVERDRVDADVDEELGEVGVVAWRLATNTDRYTVLVRHSDEVLNRAKHGRVALVEEVGEGLGDNLGR